MGENNDIRWMYEGAKSFVNREDYLLGKKIGKDFEKYSDVVNEQKPEALDALLHTRTITKPQPHASAVKTSALESYVVATEDPLVAVKVKEETRRREVLENPLMKLKFQKMLKEMMAEKQGKGDKKKKKKRKKKRVEIDEEDRTVVKKRKKKKSRESSNEYSSTYIPPNKASSVVQRTHSSNTEFEKHRKSSVDLKRRKSLEETEKRNRRSRSPSVSRSRKKSCRGSSRSSSSSESGNRNHSRNKDRRHHGRKSFFPKGVSSKRQSSSDKEGRNVLNADNGDESEASSSSRDSVRWRGKQKHSRQKSSSNHHAPLKRRRGEKSVSPKSREKRRASKTRISSGGFRAHHRKRRSSSSSKRSRTNSPEQRSYNSTEHLSQQSRSYLSRTRRPLIRSPSPSSSTSLPHSESVEKTQKEQVNRTNEINQKCHLNASGFDDCKKSETGKSCSKDASSSCAENNESEHLRLYDSHIPEHLRPKALATDSGVDEVYDEFEEEEKKRLKRFMGFGLVGAKKKDELPSTSENPYELSRKPVVPVYKKPESRVELTDEEKQKKLREMAENALWRKEIRKSNIKVASMIEDNEAADDMSGKAPSFLRNQLNTAAADLTVEQRLQSKKKTLQRSHGYMEEKFTSK